MSALGEIIDAAVLSVISEHPKLFAAQSKERAHKLLTREILRGLTRESREKDGNESGEPPAQRPAIAVSRNDPRAIAYRQLRLIAGATDPTVYGDEKLYLPAEAQTPAVLVFAECPDRARWTVVSDRAQLGAWRKFFAETLPNVARREIVKTANDKSLFAILPWPWPPAKTGKIYESVDDYPSEEDAAA